MFIEVSTKSAAHRGDPVVRRVTLSQYLLEFKRTQCLRPVDLGYRSSCCPFFNEGLKARKPFVHVRYAVPLHDTIDIHLHRNVSIFMCGDQLCSAHLQRSVGHKCDASQRDRPYIIDRLVDSRL